MKRFDNFKDIALAIAALIAMAPLVGIIILGSVMILYLPIKEFGIILGVLADIWLICLISVIMLE